MPELPDPVTLEVIRNRLHHVTQEMSAAIVKTAVSPVVSEARDFSCVLYDADGRIVAGAATVPFHFGVCAEAIGVVRARFGRTIAPGDVFLANDPYDGGGLHLQDVVVMRPVFRGRRRVGWASASGHMIDMGGLVPGSFAPNARDCYQEGIRLPPVRIVRGGAPADDLWSVLLNNVRQRDVVEMDLKSLVAGTHVAAEAVAALEAEYGAGAFRAACAAIRRLSARVVAARLAEVPRGEYVQQGWVDPKRICIAGASYGGYAALMGLVRYHELYQCGIDWVGVSDINLMYSISWSDISEEASGYTMPLLIGDQVIDAQQLKDTSPLEQAAKVRRPLLMAYGAADRRVPIKHGTDFRDAVIRTNKDVEWMVYPEEGHGWRMLETQVDFWTRVEKFLDRYLRADAK